MCGRVPGEKGATSGSAMALALGTYMTRWSHADAARSPPMVVGGLRSGAPRRLEVTGSAVPVGGPSWSCRPGSGALGTGAGHRVEVGPSGGRAATGAGGAPGCRVQPLGQASQQERGSDVPAGAAGRLGGVVPGGGAQGDDVARDRLLRGEAHGAGAHARLTCARLTRMSPLPEWTTSRACASASPGPVVCSRSMSTSPVTVLRSR